MGSIKYSVAALALALGGCATLPPAEAAQRAPASISYETGPCFGACPVYRVTVSADGTGRFDGRNFTAARGERSFRVSPAQYRAFAARLAPLRPARGSRRLAGDACRVMATDMPSAQVTWSAGAGEQIFYFYFGCDMERNRAIAERLRGAPALLPIAELIGRSNGIPVEHP
jgi:hypothetical protein